MQLLEAHGELLSDRDDELGQERRPVGVEESVERPAEAIIAQVLELFCGKPEQARGETMHRLALAVDRFALDDERAQQHAERGGVAEHAAPIGGGDVLLEQRHHADALEEVVDQG